MKFFLLMTLLIGGLETAYSQIATSPDGVASSSPAVGKNRRSQCSGQNCFEIKIQPYCFGTNLRAYSSDIQLDPNQPISISMNINSGSATNKVDFTFPANIAYNASQVRPTCTNISTSGSQKTVSCTISQDGVAHELRYQTNQWKTNKNPSCFATYGRSQDFCDYSNQPVSFNKVSGAIGENNITCFYAFDSNWGIKPEVICNFPSLMEDQTSQVAFKINDEVVTDAKLFAITNSVEVKIPINQLSAIMGNSEYKNGKLVLPKTGNSLPNVQVQYSQSGRPLEKDGYQLPDKVQRFESSNSNMSYTIIAKFPGKEGFCGGFYSPLMLFFDAQSLPEFNGVSHFPLHGVKDGGRINWPEAGNKGYFLAHLKKGVKTITTASQLFGQDGVHENGFESLKRHDSNKDGKIDSKDKVWKELVLWNDQNGNGLSEENELIPLSKMKVKSISLKYNQNRKLKFGDRAVARESSRFTFEKNGKAVESDILDVWFTPID